MTVLGVHPIRRSRRKIKGVLLMEYINIQVSDPRLIPHRAHPTDGGADLKASQKCTIPAGKTAKINTGVKVEIPEGYIGLVTPRSGLGTKHHIRLANTVGVIDSDYRGDIYVFLENGGTDDYVVEEYDRIVQLLVVPIALPAFIVADKLSETKRGTSGFGDSGKK